MTTPKRRGAPSARLTSPVPIVVVPTRLGVDRTHDRRMGPVVSITTGAS